MSSASSSTSLSLIRRVRQNEADAWVRLTQIYGPIVYRWCRRRGIKPNDAADIMQEVFKAVSQSISRYRREDGRQPFRGWLFGITANKMADFARLKVKRDEVPLRDSVTAEMVPRSELLSDESSDAIPSERNDRLVVVSRALELIRAEFSEKHWKSFWRTAIDGQLATEIAEELGISAAAVRQSKCRIVKRLRQELEELEDLE